MWLTDAEKAFLRRWPCYNEKKKPLQSEHRSKAPHLLHDSHEWPIVDITKNGEIPNVYLLRLEKMQASPLSPLLFNIVLDVLPQWNKIKKA